jgi:hypothetical protein
MLNIYFITHQILEKLSFLKIDKLFGINKRLHWTSTNQRHIS